VGPGARRGRLRNPGQRGPGHPTSWAFKDISTTISTLLKDFTSGTKMWIRVRAVGGGSERGPWSDPAAKTVP